MKKFTIILLLLISTSAIAQNIDEEKMNRDIEIAKNVLATMLKGDSEMFLGGSSITGSYVQGYGVIFTIPKHSSMLFIRPHRTVIAPRVRVRTRSTGDEMVIYEDNIDAFKKQEKLSADEEKELAEIQEELEDFIVDIEVNEDELADAIAEVEVNSEDIKVIAEEAEANAMEWQTQFAETLEESMEKIEQAIITFLADYADLIGQLKPTDNIMVKQESPYEEFLVGWSGTDNKEVININDQETKGGFSAEVSKQVISDYKTGKISFDTFKEKVKIKRAEPARKSPDLDMFASIFRQYYGPKMSSTFFTESTPSYEILDNFGVIFTVRTYSSYVEGQYYYMPVTGDTKVSSEERKAKIEELYPKFENDLKSFIIDYGRTIRSLGDDDMLLLKIGLTKCEECAIPKSIDVSVKMSVLKQFDQQKISREKALAAIEIKKNLDSSNF